MIAIRMGVHPFYLRFLVARACDGYRHFRAR